MTMKNMTLSLIFVVMDLNLNESDIDNVDEYDEDDFRYWTNKVWRNLKKKLYQTMSKIERRRKKLMRKTRIRKMKK